MLVLFASLVLIAVGILLVVAGYSDMLTEKCSEMIRIKMKPYDMATPLQEAVSRPQETTTLITLGEETNHEPRQ